MKLSVSSYSFQQYIRAQKMTQLDTVKAAAEMGFSGIEFIELSPCEKPTLEQQLDYAAKLRAEAEKYGIQIVAYTIGASLYRETAEECEHEVSRVCGQVDVAAALGAGILRHDVCYSERQNGRVVSFEQMLPVIAANARQITEYAQKKGIRTCTENHGFIAQDSDRVERLYNAVAHENYGLLLDIGNFACADEDSARAVSRLAPYAIHVHAKDFVIYPFGAEIPEGTRHFTSRACNRLAGCSVGKGNIPVRQCLSILKRAGYDGFLAIEYEGSEDCIIGITEGLAYLTNALEQLK